MNKLLTLAVLLFLSQGIEAKEWISPVDLKYKRNHAKLYEKFDKAKTLINNYEGNTEELVQAKEILDTVLSTKKHFAPAHLQYARIILKMGYINYSNFSEGAIDAAESTIRKAIKLEPKYADAYVLLGYLYTSKKKYVEAVKALLEADRIGTGSSWLDFNWGDLYWQLDDADEAIKRTLLVIEKGPDNKAAYNSALSQIAFMYSGTQKYEEAKKWYEKLIEYKPDNAWNLMHYGSFLLFYYGDTYGAVKSLEKSLDIMDFGMGRHIYACGIYTQWAYSYGDDGENSTAKALYKKAQKIQPDLEVIRREIIKYPKTRFVSAIFDKQITKDYMLKLNKRNK